MPPATTMLILGLGAMVFVQASLLVLRSPVLPDSTSFLLGLVNLLPSMLGLLFPVAFLVGMTVAFGRWQGDGTWTALRASGRNAAGMLAHASILGLGVAVLTGLVGSWLAPMGNREAAGILDDAALSVRLVPGSFLDLGETVVYRITDGSLFVHMPGMAMVARSGVLERQETGMAILLREGRIIGESERASRISFQSAQFPLEVAAATRRIQLNERSFVELLDLVRRMERAGKDASYEKTVMFKRLGQPIAVLLLPLVAIPLGLRLGGRPLHLMGVVIWYWVLVRLGDQLCGVLGPLVSASLPMVGLLFLSGLLWAGWRDR